MTLAGQAIDSPKETAMPVRKTLALALIALAASGGSAALAATIQVSDDRRGDATCSSSPCPDLKSAVANPGIFNKQQLFYIITQHNSVQRSRVPRIAINTSGAGTSAPEFYVEKRSSGTGVFNAKTGRKTGPAALSGSGRTALSWTFLPSAIANPRSFGWRVEVQEPGKKIDATPNSGYITRTLR
jgi:hypothetical protein